MAGGTKAKPTEAETPEQRARAAMTAGRFADAGRYFLEARLPYEAAACFQKAQQPKDSLEALLRVPVGSLQYRGACVQAARIAIGMDEPLERLINYVLPFLAIPPTSPLESAAFKELAGEFAKSGRKQQARAIYERVLKAFPDDGDAREALQAIPLARQEVATKPSGKRFTEILIERGKLQPAKLQLVLKEHGSLQNDDLALGEALVVNAGCTELDVLEAQAEQLGVPYISASVLLATAEPEAAGTLTVEQAERWRVLPLAVVDRQLWVATREPKNIDLADQVRFAAGVTKVNGVLASETSIRKGIRKLYHGEDQDAGSVEEWKLWEAESADVEVSRFSDRVTGTREQAFDTHELEFRNLLEVSPGMDEKRPGQTVPIEPAQPTEIELGMTIANRYRIEKTLGKGGTATVYRALDLELNEPVALKIFSAASHNDALVARFKQELSLTRRLAHPNIIRLFDLGTHLAWRYLSMELLDGTDLGTLLKPKKPLPIVEGLVLLSQACSGLQAAHEVGVIHRDVKPENIFITTKGVVKLMDFGIARQGDAPKLTQTGTIAGTPWYMSPEQISDFSSVTHSADLYALGATAYAVFTGAPPFDGDEIMQVLFAHMNKVPPPPREKNPAIPEALERLILRLLEKSPKDRYPSCRELEADLSTIREALRT